MAREYSIAEARRQFASLVDEVQQGRTVRLTRRGKTVAVLLSVSEFDRLVSARPPLWPALAAFRAAGAPVDDVDEVFQDVRDRTPGRPIDAS